MGIPFIDRDPTPDEVEAIRYLLSAYTGAIGSQRIRGKFWPGWREFERVIALVVGGWTLENKGPYDISIQLSQNNYAGISCKVKKLDPTIGKRKRLYLEVSNKNSATKVCVGGSENFVLPGNPCDAFAIGEKLIECIESEYGINASRQYNYDINRLGLVLMHWNIDDSGKFWFTLYNWRGPFRIFDTITHWECRDKSLKGFADEKGKDLVLEWYPSGGHIKYYPYLGTVNWQSEQMYLEEIKETVAEFLIERVLSKFGAHIRLPVAHIPYFPHSRR